MNNNRFVHIRALNVDLVDVTPATQEIFRPYPGKRLIVTKVIADIRSLTLGGTPTDPHIVLDNGTDGNDIVADVSLGHVVLPKDLTVVYSKVVDSDNPLRLKKATAAAATTGTAKYKVDLEIFGVFK